MLKLGFTVLYLAKDRLVYTGYTILLRHAGAYRTTLTSNQHEDDGEYFFVVSVGGNVAKANRDEAGEAKVETSAIAALEGWGEWGTGKLPAQSGPSPEVSFKKIALKQ